MAEQKKFRMKRFNGTDYDQLLPETTIEQVDGLQTALDGKQTKVTATGILKGDGAGTVSAATAGTDYATPSAVEAKYTKPSTGIPKADLASDVQTSLGKADNAVLYVSQALTDAQKTLARSNIYAADYATQIKVTGLLYDNAGAHNSIYRGKNLGTSVTAEQYAAIKAGTFDDLYIGDYWVINGFNWRIAAFNYYYNTGDTACTTNHVTVVPDTNLYSEQMHWTITHAYDSTLNKTTGAYFGSNMRSGNPTVSEMIKVIQDSSDSLWYVVTTDNSTKVTSGYSTEAEAKTAMESVTWAQIQAVHPTTHRTLYDNSGALGIIEKAFGESHILQHRLILTNSMSGSVPNGWAWQDSKVELMTQANVYGSAFWQSGYGAGYNAGVDKSQYPLFALEPNRISNNRSWYWLRDVPSSTHFAFVNGLGLSLIHI